MNIETDSLIERLARSAKPVRPLANPWRRASFWLMLALPYLVMVVLLMTPRSDLPEKLHDPRFLLEESATLVTAVLAAAAAFSATVPGRSRLVLLLPLPSLLVWLGSLGMGCVEAWLQFGAQGPKLQQDWACLPAIAITGGAPAIVIVAMLRRGAPLLPHITVGLGALAAAALGNFALRLFHPQDASLMVLVWQFGTVALYAAIATMLGGRLLSWKAIQISNGTSP